MTKNEFKKIAQTATKIVSEEKYTGYSGSTSQVEKTVSYDEMIEELGHCRYAVAKAGDAILVSSSIGCFTVYL